MAFEPEFNVGLVQANVDLFAFGGGGNRVRGALPRIVSLYYSAALATALEIYLAPAGGGSGATRIELVNATTASEARFCYPVWITSAGVPWHLFINKADTGGAGTAFVRLEWDAGGDGS